MFIATPFTTAKTWKQPQCPLKGEWMKRMWHVYTTEYYSDTESETVPLAATWIELEIIILNQVNQKEKDKYCMISPICRI